MTGTSVDRTKLAALLGMIGSDHDGEALNAARLAHRMVREAGATWEVLTARVEPHSEPPSSIRQAIMFCWDRREHLTDWEKNFIWSLMRLHPRPSPKQGAILVQIVDKLQAMGRRQ